MSSTLVEIAFGVYGVMLAAGGWMGYRKAGSRPSLIAGSISAVVAIGALLLCFLNLKIGCWVGAALSVAMLGFFAPRYLKSKKMMPAGMMSVASALVLAMALMMIAQA